MCVCFPNPECVVRKPVKGFGSCCGMGPLFNWYARRRGRRHCRPFDWPRTRSAAAAARKSMPLFLFSCKKKNKNKKKSSAGLLAIRDSASTFQRFSFVFFFLPHVQPGTHLLSVSCCWPMFSDQQRDGRNRKRERERE